MEGYSVTEAASVLGVPTERVWELLARGVLAGHPEGDTGMRVFLQPRPAAPSPMQMPPPAPPPEREPERELSPFRELLTEFRNLTERYGQALLALGEARGEVASLRSRVDLLEARMDLRLPMEAAPIGPPIGWQAPRERVVPPPEPVPEPVSAEAEADDDEAGVQPSSRDESDEGAERHHRRRSSRHATESFAEALARAEDPTVPELPELYREPMVEAAPADAALPRELPVAEAMPTVDEAIATDTITEPGLGPVEAATEVSERERDVEPMWAEASDEGVPEVSMPSGEEGADAAGWSFEEPMSGPPPQQQLVEEEAAPGGIVDAASAPAGAEEDSGAEPAAEWHDPGAADAMDLEVVPEPEPPVEAEADGEVARAATAEPEPATVDAPRGEQESEPEVEVEPDQPVGPLAWDPERYSTEIGEPDWYAEEEPPLASVAAPTPVSEEPAADELASEGPDADDSAPAIGEALGDAGSSQAAGDAEGWPASPSRSEPDDRLSSPEDPGSDEMEVAAAGHAAPGSWETGDQAEDALDALDALSRTAGRESTPPSSMPWPGTIGGPAAHRPSPLGTPSTFEPGTTRPVRPAPTPASRAYRRLRRIFPG